MLAVVDEIQGAGGIAAAFTADVTDELQVVGLVAAVVDGLGPVDVLVLNATGPQPEAPLTEVSWEDHLAQLEFFVKSPVFLGRAVVPGMEARRWGAHHPGRLRSRGSNTRGQVRLRDGEERADWSHPQLGA
jgi:3-oxoacyl-[acyl-carrier protein] reductase